MVEYQHADGRAGFAQVTGVAWGAYATSVTREAYAAGVAYVTSVTSVTRGPYVTGEARRPPRTAVAALPSRPFPDVLRVEPRTQDMGLGRHVTPFQADASGHDELSRRSGAGQVDPEVAKCSRGVAAPVFSGR
jgi:hypothetical protein